ncbi:MAG: DUF1775 domain-containing protein [Candidimonas sp.]|nr:MAG: DUF1775 domain-containing protein [Candidimonas sp.]
MSALRFGARAAPLAAAVLAAGGALYLPVAQICETGATRWISKPSDDKAAGHGGTPAPALTLLPKRP